MTEAIFHRGQEGFSFDVYGEYKQACTLGSMPLEETSENEDKKKFYKKIKLGQIYESSLRGKEEHQNILRKFAFAWDAKNIIDMPLSRLGSFSNLFYSSEVSPKLPTSSGGVLNIKLKNAYLKDQKNHLVKELGLDQAEAQIISDMIRQLVELKIKDAGKKWSEDVKRAFANLMTAILIEETKAIRSISRQTNRTMSSTYYKPTSLCQI
ncbi:MAG: hypothetical protein ACXQTR_05910 [Candidatus Methanospirareceae archaeon]